jgi:predicted transport protein
MGLFEYLKEVLFERMDPIGISVQKSQIAFRSRRSFAYVWLPIRPMRNRPNLYIILSFGLDHLISSPRIVEAAEVRPNRWTHHLIISKCSEIDEEVLNWLDQAFQFSLR